jgi:hypothetical protein
MRIRHDRDRESNHHQQDDGDRSHESERPDQSEHLPSIRDGLPAFIVREWRPPGLAAMG